MEANLAFPRASGRRLLPYTDGLVAAARSEHRRNAVDAGGWVPGETPNPIGVAVELLKLPQLEVSVVELRRRVAFHGD